MLPRWLDLETLRLVAILAIFVLGISALKVLRIIRQPSLQVVATVLVFALGLAVWTFQDNLEDCATTCDCRVVGFDVQFGDAQMGRCAYTDRT